jgi:hypothetical protein
VSGPRNLSEALEQTGTMFKHVMPSRVEEAREAETAVAAHWRELCAYVNRRDELCCRACGRRVNPHAMSMLQKGHHHHVVYRSAGGQDTKENVCLLCSDCHSAEHVKRALSIEGNAEAAPWLAISKRSADGRWYLWRQETGIRQYVEVD